MTNEQKTIFKLSNDEFVNEAMVELARLAELDEDKITPTEIKGTKEDLDNIINSLEELYSNTHRRTTDTRYLNSYTDNEVSSPEVPFPDDEEVFDEGKITKEILEKRDIPTDNFPNTSETIFSKRPYYTGPPIENSWTTKRIDRYKDALKEVLFGTKSVDTEHTCRSCGRSDLPNWKFEGEDIEFNQQFTPYITKSGRPKSMGQKGSQDSNYRGRCVACNVAGFAYSLITKPFYTENPGEYRIFTLKSDFEGLLSVRKAYMEQSNMLSIQEEGSETRILSPLDTDSDTTGEYSKALPSNIPVQSSSDKAQLLSMLSKLNQATIKREFKGEHGFQGSELIQKVTGATVYKSSNSKGNNPVRGITQMKSYSFSKNIKYYIQPVSYKYDGQTKRYYPHQLINSLSSIGEQNVDLEIYSKMIDRIAEGILDEDLSKIESGLFGLTKPVINEQANVKSPINLLGGTEYIEMLIREMTDLSEQELEALSSVGSSLGRLFDTRDDVSVLIGLKNSNQLNQFLQSLEHAGMEGMKKALVRGEHIPRFEAIREDHLSTALQTLSQKDKFEPAKQVIVTHASFSALYENSTTTNNDNNNGE